jgi:hypothetical protein
MDFNTRPMLKVKPPFQGGYHPIPSRSQAINNSADYLIYVFHLAI